MLLCLIKWPILGRGGGIVVSAPTIRVRIPLAPKFFSNCTVRKDKNKRKRGREWPIKKINDGLAQKYYSITSPLCI